MKNLLAKLSLTAFFSLTALNAEIMDISGEWKVSIDDGKSYGNITLPSDIASQGYGEKPNTKTNWVSNKMPEITKQYEPFFTDENFKISSWLQPDLYYRGIALFKKNIEIPADWEGKRIVISFERPHTSTILYINKKEVGDCVYMGVPHTYDITDFVKSGNNLVEISVDNEKMISVVGTNSHSVADHTQGAWNGIVGDIYVQSMPKVYIDDVQVYPNEDLKSAKVKVKIVQPKEFENIEKKFTFSIGDKVCFQKDFQSELSDLEFDITIDNAQPWSEFSPKLYNAKAILTSKLGESVSDFNFGMRFVKTDGLDILLNNRKIYFRGTLESCIFPLTGYPSTDEKWWVRMYEIAKSHGLNHIRFHSWCPPKVAFDVADKMGFYLQVENSNWGAPGVGKPIDKWTYAETDAMLKAYGNHPSFILYCHGNEPLSKEEPRNEFLGEWVNYGRQKDSRHLYTTGAGRHNVPIGDYDNPQEPRIQRWKEDLASIINANSPNSSFDFNDCDVLQPKPTISHEIGQWCAYPDFDEIKKYTGILKAKNFEVFQSYLKDSGLIDQAKDFLMASGELQVLCYKADIEGALRTSKLSGFQLLDLHDFPGQGTALVGVLDAFWDSKPYCTPEEYSRFCNTVVPLALMDKFVFDKSENIKFTPMISNFDDGELENAKFFYELKDSNGNVISKKEISLKDSKVPYCASKYPQIDIDSGSIKSPAMLNLSLIVESDNKKFINDWDIWLMSNEKTDLSKLSNVKIVSKLDEKTKDYLANGGAVWLRLSKLEHNKYGLGFSTIFWNTNWTDQSPPLTMGILCDPENEALRLFPTKYHSGYQWWDIIYNASVIDMFDSAIKPNVQIVPDWFAPKKLSLAFEGKYGKGKIFVTSIDFDAKAQTSALNQLESSFADYINSDEFSPKTEISDTQLERIIENYYSIEK